MATPHEYYLQVIGKGFDEDGAYGIQCVDGFKHFCRTVLGYDISHTSICSPTGYACSIWDNFDALGLGEYFDKVPANRMLDGDWAIWSMGSRSCPYSHVAMFRLDNGNGTGIFLGQNQVGGPEYNQINIYYDGIRGGLRPKIYHLAPPVDDKTYVNLPPTIEQWRFYNLDDAPVKQNAQGFLKPAKFGGLSYYVYDFRDNGTTAVIQTQQFGRVKIYIAETCATITTGHYDYESGNHTP